MNRQGITGREEDHRTVEEIHTHTRHENEKEENKNEIVNSPYSCPDSLHPVPLNNDIHFSVQLLFLCSLSQLLSRSDQLQPEKFKRTVLYHCNTSTRDARNLNDKCNQRPAIGVSLFVYATAKQQESDDTFSLSSLCGGSWNKCFRC